MNLAYTHRSGWYRKDPSEAKDKVHFFDNKVPISLCGHMVFYSRSMVGGAKKPFRQLCKHCERMVTQR